MIMVRLTREDEIIAHTAGLARESHYGSNPKFLGNKGNFHNAVVIHSEAVGAEMAVAKYFGVADFVPTVNTFKNEPDVYWNGVAIEVKQTPHKRGHLIISEDDRDTDIAVLVVGKSPVYHIAGWLPVAFARRKRFKNPRQDSWWVDQANLNPIETLVRSEYATAAI